MPVLDQKGGLGEGARTGKHKENTSSIGSLKDSRRGKKRGEMPAIRQ